jgi:uncharacterized protein (TIGR02246 family)
VILINRVKPHTDFDGAFASGLIKMSAIGLGKAEGAIRCHWAASTLGHERVIREVSALVLSSLPRVYGIARVMNAADVRDLYERMIAGWNAGDAAAMTRDFADDGQMVGFDGSEAGGREQIASHLAGIFADHKVASFVTLVHEVREIAPNVMLLRAHAGMVPPGKSEINRAANAVPGRATNGATLSSAARDRVRSTRSRNTSDVVRRAIRPRRDVDRERRHVLPRTRPPRRRRARTGAPSRRSRNHRRAARSRRSVDRRRAEAPTSPRASRCRFRPPVSPISLS